MFICLNPFYQHISTTNPTERYYYMGVSIEAIDWKGGVLVRFEGDGRGVLRRRGRERGNKK